MFAHTVWLHHRLVASYFGLYLYELSFQKSAEAGMVFGFSFVTECFLYAHSAPHLTSFNQTVFRIDIRIDIEYIYLFLLCKEIHMQALAGFPSSREVLFNQIWIRNHSFCGIICNTISTPSHI